MLTRREIAAAFFGIWRLVHFDAGGLAWFDRSEDGFWRSFRVAVLLAPIVALMLAAQLVADPALAQVGWFRFFLVEGIAYVIGWTAFPLAAFYLARALDRESDYFGFIAVYNWSALLQVALELVIAVAVRPESALGQFLILLGLLLFAIYEWFITRTTLRLDGLTACGVVAIDQTMTMLLSLVIVRLLR